MITLAKLRSAHPNVIVFGDHPGIIQSVLDFDFLAGRGEPSIAAIVGVNRGSLRYFFGKSERRIAAYTALDEVPEAVRKKVMFFAVAQSGRRAVEAAKEAIQKLPNASGGMIFAEGVPEKHALDLRSFAAENNRFILGPASVGMTIGGVLKLGAIGGTVPVQIAASSVLREGSAAVISTSGGMINELINAVGRSGAGISFAAAVGGERFPVTKPVELVAAALADDATRTIVFFGEVGGRDEYEIAELLQQSKTPKPFIAYIAGVSAELFESAPQFGHAKALAQNQQETASAKKQVLRAAGATVADSFGEFQDHIARLGDGGIPLYDADRLAVLESRKSTMFHANVTADNGGEVRILGKPLTEYVSDKGIAEVAFSMLLGQQLKSAKTAAFFETSLKLLVDHGPQVSGAVNTIITARAGRDLPSALAAGLLTIGPRFGGAINEAAANWLQAVETGETPSDFVERFARAKVYIPGIGHKKYSVDHPDPRVAALHEQFGTEGRFTAFALKVAAITTGKKNQLIMNVDGAIAALVLDMLESEELYTADMLHSLVATEFCNAIFVLARSIGFTAHYLDQKRLDEGLFRLPDAEVSPLS